MRSINDYTDDELQRLLAKSRDTGGAGDRVAALQAALAERGVSEDGRSDYIASLMGNDPAPTIPEESA